MRSVLRQAAAAIALILSSLFCSSCSPGSQTLTAFSASTHVLTASPSSVGFGSQALNATAAQSVVLTNSGTGSVQVQSLSVSGSTAFQVQGFTGTITLQPSQTLNLTINFTPTAAVSYAGMLAINASDGASTSVALSGSGSSVTVTITPTSAMVAAGLTQQFTASVTGTTNGGVNWVVNGVLGGNSTWGTISAAGLYTAPAIAPSGGTATVAAESVADNTKSASASVTIATVYSNIDDSTTIDPGGGTYGWGWCGSPACAGGGSTATQKISWGQQPSMDGGGSTQFLISGSAWADGLWWYKVGPNDNVSHFQFEFWLNVSQAATAYSLALEFDMFQFVSPTEYMFGTECNYSQGYSNGTWDVWNQNTGQWTHTSFSCPSFVPGDWYHITWSFNRTSDQYEHYNSVAVEHYDSSGTTRLDSSNTPVNMALPSGALPSGWSDNLGINFQLDINGVPGSTGTATYTTLVDKVTLTVW